MTPVLREGPEAPGAPGWEATVASTEASVVASWAGVTAGVGAGAEAAELADSVTSYSHPLPLGSHLYCFPFCDLVYALFSVRILF